MSDLPYIATVACNVVAIVARGGAVSDWSKSMMRALWITYAVVVAAWLAFSVWWMRVNDGDTNSLVGGGMAMALWLVVLVGLRALLGWMDRS